MCGRYTLTRQQGLIEDLEATLDPAVERNVWWKPRFNVAPTQDAPVVTLRDGVRTLEMMRWGLVPSWAGKGAAHKPPLMINARVESVAQKPVFRDALARKRCLVPADGFFEWKHQGKTKQPMYIHRAEPGAHPWFAFAGLWTRAQTETGELHSFTIVTGPPSELVAPIHDRMPIVLPRDRWAAWLDPSLDAAGAVALLGAPAADKDAWRADPVSSWVNRADHDDPRCVEPPDIASRPAQSTLFD